MISRSENSHGAVHRRRSCRSLCHRPFVDLRNTFGEGTLRVGFGFVLSDLRDAAGARASFVEASLVPCLCSDQEAWLREILDRPWRDRN